MREKIAQQYDSLYESKDEAFGGEPLPSVVKLTEYLPEGRVLDVGGGEGVNALYLAKNGYQVTVSDVSKVGIEKMLAKAEEEDLQIVGRVGDGLEGITESFDAIVNTFVLHHLDAKEAEELIREIQLHTNPDGFNVIATFINEGGLFERNQKSNSGRYYPTPEDVTQLYEGWEVLLQSVKETTSLAKDKEGNHLRNMRVVLIARKNTDSTSS